MDRSFIERNAAARERVRAFLERLSEADRQRVVGHGWTVTAALAHLAFWERCHLHRLERWAREGAPPAVDPDAVNEAALPGWTVIPPRAAGAQLLDAMERIDAWLAAIPPELAQAVIAAGYTFMLERSRHRTAHLDEIEGALAGAATRSP